MATIARMDVRLGMNSSDFEDGVKKAEAAGESLSNKLGKIGQGMTAGITLPIVGAAGAALKFATDFNSSMANVASLGVASDRVIELKGNVQALAIETGKSTEDLAGGLYQVVSAFGDSADTSKILEINAKAAAAGLAETTDAINLTSAVTKGYGDTSAAAVQSVSDMALQTVALGQTTFPELAASMGRVVPIAASLGASQQELFAVMATATGVTGGAAEVSTQLRGVLQSLMAPTEGMTTLMQSMGYQTGAAMLKGEGLQGTIAAIVQASEASGQPLQSYIGSIEGQTLALALAGPQADAYAQKLAAMGGAAGATDKAFLAQTQGINAAGFGMQQVAIKAQVLMQNLGDGLAPALGILLDKLTPVADAALWLSQQFAQADAGTQTMIAAAIGLVAALGPVLAMLPAISTALGVLTGPVGLVVAAVVGLGVAWQTNFGGIRDITTGVLSQLTTAFGQIMEVVSGFNEGYLDLGETVWGVAQVISGGQADYYAISGAITTVQTAVLNTVGPLQNLVEVIADAGLGSIEAGEAIGALPAFLQPVALAFQNMYLAVMTAAATLSALLAPAISRVQEAFAGVGPALAGLGPQLQGLLDAFVNLWTAVQPILQQLGMVMATVFGVASVLAVNLFAQAINSIGPIVSTVITQITDSINMVATVLTEATALVSAIIAGDWSAAWSSAQSIFATFSEYFRSTIKRFSTLAGTVFENIYTAIMDTLNDLGVDVPSILDGIQATWDSIWAAMKDALSPVTDAIGAVQKAIEDFSNWLGSLTLPNPFAAISDAASAAAGAVSGLMGGSGQPEGKAVGGAVSSGVPYIVGERGRELFVPNVNGTIIPNSQLNGWMADRSAGSGANVTLNNYGDLNNSIDLLVLRQMLREAVSA